MNDYQKLIKVLDELDIPTQKQEAESFKSIDFIDCSLNKVNFMFDKNGNLDFPKDDEIC